jgi:predicted outer membrane repeat protein
VTISGNQATRIFFILAEAVHVNLNRLTIADGWSPDATSGGGIVNYGSLFVESCTLINNAAGGDGGAIYNTGSGSLYVRNSTLTNNRAGGYGGAIYDLTDFTLGLRNVTITGNAATRAGGVWLTDSGLASRYAYNTIIADQLTGGNCNAPFDGSSNPPPAGQPGHRRR